MLTFANLRRIAFVSSFSMVGANSGIHIWNLWTHVQGTQKFSCSHDIWTNDDWIYIHIGYFESHNALFIGPFLLLNFRASVKLQLACAKGWSPIELLNRPGDRVTGGNGSVWVSINFPIFVTLSYDPTISWCQCIRSFEGRAPSVPGKILKKHPSPYWISYFLLYEN